MQRSLLLLLLACAPLACKPVAEPTVVDAPLSGRQIFMARCVSCHQADGDGLPAICPPLADSPRLTGSPEDLIRILLLGMKGTIIRNGTTYRGIMPAWKFDLSDAQITDTINDLYARWNPRAPMVTEEMVRRTREETAGHNLFPTSKDLKLSN